MIDIEQFQQELERGVRTLVRRDRVIGDLKRAHGLPTLTPRTDHVGTLVRSILSQQISGAAARTIIGRVQDLTESLGDVEAFDSISDQQLRECGVSGQKVGYLRSLIEHVRDDRIQPHHLGALPDEEVIRALTDVKGIGTWTAKMFLMFSLGRLDVFPFEDLGVRQGMRKAFGIEQDLSRDDMLRIAEERKWGPYRSIASWYMWRALE